MGKEVSSKSLLIVSGCSHSNVDLPIYGREGITAWPKLVADELDMNLLCLGRAYADNDYIANVVMDAVLDYSNITVMVLWTDSARWPAVQEKFREDPLTYNLRCMWRLNYFLRQQEVPFFQAATSCPTAGLDPQPSNEDIFKNRYFSKDYFTTQAPTDNMIWMDNKELTILNDSHPNQKGHDWIAETFLLQYYSAEFVYD